MNRIPEEIRFKLTECYYKLKIQNSYITGESIKRLYTGEDKMTDSLLSLFGYHTLNSKQSAISIYRSFIGSIITMEETKLK